VCYAEYGRMGAIVETKKPLLSVKSDFIFKLIFGDQRNVDILAAFLRSVLDIPDEEYDSLTIVDPHIKKESEDDKYGILDVKINTVGGGVIHVEIQLRVFSDLEARTVYSQSKLLVEQMKSGMKWAMLRRTITIVITEEVFVPEGDKYHNQFRYRTDDGIEFSRLSEINTLDLGKLPPDDDSTDLWYWLKFIKSDNEEDMDMLATRSPQMKKAVGVLKELSADERTRMLYEAREKARMDFESLRDDAVREAERLVDEKWQDVVAGKEAEIADRDAEIAGKDAEIAALKAQLAGTL